MCQSQWCSKLIACLVIVANYVGMIFAQPSVGPDDIKTPASPGVISFIQQHCVDCHSEDSPESGLNLITLSKQTISDINFDVWTKVHDRVVAHEMPPKSELTEKEILPIKQVLFDDLVELDRKESAASGRSVWRRMNRYEYENSLRELLAAPWLQLKAILPEDGELQRFNKIGEALDTSHVNLARYMQAAEYALREVTAKTPDPPE
ncbi:MAG TPA: DUF1587 domain-containing protein, partial [Pirellula sp.]|nr:DUF1587 domain-containing protein [Pirellula sp.]